MPPLVSQDLGVGVLTLKTLLSVAFFIPHSRVQGFGQLG